MVEIKGIEKFASRDFPGFISSTIFLGECNFRCPFCHNSDLVLRSHMLPTFSLDSFLGFLDSRKNWLEGICVSGGEPLIHEDLEVLLRLIKERNLLVKLDTNGSLPSGIKDLMQKKLIDHIAMDVKAPLEKYQEITGSEVAVEAISESIDIIKNSGLAYTFRTTVVPDLIGTQDIEKICQLLNGAQVYQIQQFVPSTTIEDRFLQKKPYRREEIKGFAKIAESYFPEVRIEGI